MNAEHVRSAKAPSLRTGFFATLSTLLRADGSGAPSRARPLGIAPPRRSIALIAPAVLLLTLALAPAPAPALASAGYVHSATFSGEGTGDGQLAQFPGRAAVEPSTGNLFVVDSGNDRVQVFAPNGSGGADYLAQFGSGQLSEPWGIAIDETAGQTAVYVSDAGNDRIVKYDSDEAATPAFALDGSFNLTAGKVGDYKAALAVTPNSGDPHDLLVADPGNDLVERFGSDGAFISSFDGSEGTGSPGAFTGLLDIALDGESRIYVIDSNGDIAAQGGTSQGLRYSSTGKYKATLAPLGPSQRPATLAANPEDHGDLPSVAVSGEQDAAYNNGSPTLHLFDFAESPFGSPTIEDPYGSVSGLAFAALPSDRLYVVLYPGLYGGSPYSGSPQIQAFEFRDPPAVTIDPVDTGSVTGEEATFTGTVDPNEFATDWHFEYSITGFGNWQSTPVETTAATDSPLPVSATVTGLQPNTDYTVRLIASNAGGPETSAAPDPEFTTAGSAPRVSIRPLTGLTQTGATLGAAVNPRNDATTYHFEYGPADCASNPCASTAESAPIGHDLTDHEVTATLTGLSPATTYHYRAVATNGTGSTPGTPDRAFTTYPANGIPDPCPNAKFRTGPSANLPDCRAYEMVSPLGKNGGDIAGRSLRTRAASDGNALQFASTSAFGDAIGTAIAVDYVAVRTDQPGTQGWATHAITPPQDAGSYLDIQIGQLDPSYIGEFSDDLTRGVYMSRTALTPAPNAEGYVNLYLRNDLLTAGPGNYQLLTDCPSCLGPPPGASPYSPFEHPGLAGASSDFGQVIFESFRNLTADAIGAGLDENLPKLYEWDHGTLRLAGILPDSACGSPPCLAPSSAAGHGAGADTLYKQYSQNTISSDGTRIVFASPVNRESRDPEHEGDLIADLYLRENHTTTVQVNAEERTIAPDPPADATARFQAASADLSRIFFTTTEQLTDDDQTENSRDLYMYDASLPASDPHNLTRLITDEEPDDGHGGIQKVFGASAQGDYLYFSANNQLIDDGIAGETVTPCGHNPCIFVWHDGQIHFVGRIGPNDADALASENWDGVRLWSSRVTPDGKHFLFLSEGAEGDPYDHTAGCNGEVDKQGGGEWFSSGPGCAELYLYDATANGGNGDLTCVSCNPGGAHTTATETRIDYSSPYSALGRTSHLSHPISNDGRFVFFSTGEPLSPDDINGSVYDVYRYDSLTGSVRLITSGESPHGSFFLDASADGSDAFFVTSERLTGWDLDGQADVYTARIDGGVADPPPPPPGCQGDACQPAPSALNDPTPASANLIGAGNLRSARQGCAKGQRRIRRHGKRRCVNKSTRQQRKNRADSNRRASR